MKRKKASRAKKAAAAATRNTAPSPRQEVEMPTMPAWLSAIIQWFKPVPAVDTSGTATSGPARRMPQISQAEMYRARLESPAARAWNQKQAKRHFPPGPSISELNAKDAQVVDPYEQKALHVDYLTIRATSKSEWDICSACYFQNSEINGAKKKNLNRHFETKHDGQARESCSVCMAMFLTQHLKWHTEYCHPGIAVK